MTEEIGEALEKQSSYTPEFRRNAVEYVVSNGKTYAEIAASLSVYESTLARWVRDARREEPSVNKRRGEAGSWSPQGPIGPVEG